MDSPPPHSPDYDPETSHGRYPPAEDLYGRRVGREEGRVERWKDMWNQEVRGVARWVQAVDVGSVSEGVERRWAEWREGGRRV